MPRWRPLWGSYEKKFRVSSYEFREDYSLSQKYVLRHPSPSSRERGEGKRIKLLTIGLSDGSGENVENELSYENMFTIVTKCSIMRLTVSFSHEPAAKKGRCIRGVKGNLDKEVEP
jgi:hypothetical protein